MKKRLVARIMMVAVATMLVACSGKETPKETAAGGNDSAVAATTETTEPAIAQSDTGTTEAAVAPNDTGTTEADVSEVEEDQVGETSTGTLGDETTLVDTETFSLDDPNLFDNDTSVFYVPQHNGVAPTYNAFALKKKYNNPNEHSFDTLYIFKYRPEVVGKTINLSVEAPYIDNVGIYPFESDTQEGIFYFETYLEDIYGSDKDKYYQCFQIKGVDLGDLSSDEACQAQLDREWPTITEEYKDTGSTEGDFVDVIIKGEKYIFVIREITEHWNDGKYTVKGYCANIIDREKGLESIIQYLEDEAHYDDNRAYNVIRGVKVSNTILDGEAAFIDFD